MKKYFLLMILAIGFLSSCSDNDPVEEPEIIDPVEPELTREDYPVEDFMYQAMQEVYLYKPEVALLANNFFTAETNYVDFLSGSTDPEEFFYDNLVASKDRFSFVTDDYVQLENSFSGVSKSNGLKYGLGLFANSEDVYAVVRYIAPNSAASRADIERGDIFTTINGTALNLSNYQNLLGLDSYTITLASLSNNTISNTNETVTLTKEANFVENPIHIAKTLDFEGNKVGYLMYNSYVRNFDDELNEVFAQFKADGITDLVLDLRYNGGGSVDSAIDLTSMITGQFNDQVIIKEKWNPEYQAYFESESPESLINKFNSTIYTGTTDEQQINSLNLNRLFGIGTGSTASASELTIIGLKPYIPVTTIGSKTVGKFEASITLYDSPNFGRANANPNHTYAIQPLIFTYANAMDVVGPSTGLVPDIAISEDLANFGELGNSSEPLLSAALNSIAGKSFSTKRKTGIELNQIGESGMSSPTYQKMYIDKIPQIKK